MVVCGWPYGSVWWWWLAVVDGGWLWLVVVGGGWWWLAGCGWWLVVVGLGGGAGGGCGWWLLVLVVAVGGVYCWWLIWRFEEQEGSANFSACEWAVRATGRVGEKHSPLGPPSLQTPIRSSKTSHGNNQSHPDYQLSPFVPHGAESCRIF